MSSGAEGRGGKGGSGERNGSSTGKGSAGKAPSKAAKKKRDCSQCATLIRLMTELKGYMVQMKPKADQCDQSLVSMIQSLGVNTWRMDAFPLCCRLRGLESDGCMRACHWMPGIQISWYCCSAQQSTGQRGTVFSPLTALARQSTGLQRALLSVVLVFFSCFRH